jgi:hypothetical protein
MPDDFQTARCFVEIKLQPETGAMMSSHGPLTPEDQARMDEWPSGGLVQTSNALFVEALRQETYVMAMTLISRGAEPENMTAKDLADRVRMQVLRTLDHIGLGVAREVLGQVTTADDAD